MMKGAMSLLKLLRKSMKKIKFSKTELTVFICMIALCIFGCIMVYSASCYSSQKNFDNQWYFLVKQIIGVLIGLCGFVFFLFFDYKKLKKFKWLMFAVSVVLLVLVFIPGIGISNYGARRWIGFFGFSFQPSEIAKFSLVLFCACHFAKNKDTAKSFKIMLLPLMIGAVFCLLVILEPNMSITMCLAIVMVCMMFFGGTNLKYFVLLGCFALIMVPVLIIIEPYRLQRLMAFLDPWASPQGEGFQLIQSLYSLGNGGLFGVGLFSSRQKYLYLPFAESDFIFSIICEELGFFGASIIVIIFAVLVGALIKISLNSKDRFASLLVAGIACVISVQVILNIAVVTGSIPPTGLPLPFISAGSTSLMVFMSAIGVCLNVARQSKKI